MDNIFSIKRVTTITSIVILYALISACTTSTNNESRKSWKHGDGKAVNRPGIIENKNIGYNGYSLKTPTTIRTLSKSELPKEALNEVNKQKKMVRGITRNDMRVFKNSKNGTIVYFIVETHKKINSFRELSEKDREGFLNAMIGDEISSGSISDSGFFKHEGRSGLYVDIIENKANRFGRYIYILGHKNEVFRIHGLTETGNAEILGNTINEIIQSLTIN